jgi:hypothetical protein
VRAVELSLLRRTAVAAVSLCAIAGNRGKNAVFVNPPQALAGELDEKQIARAIEVDAKGTIELRLDGGRAVPSIATAGHEDNFLRGRQALQRKGSQ